MAEDRGTHERFMRLALRLAAKAEGQTSPNPLVGAVVVKNARVLSRGYHKMAGLAHAEAIALDEAGASARGASLYVTLEPCCHFGRTAPCVEKIKASGIKEVICAMSDPNPLNNGKGAQFLRRHGIKVVSGILEEEARKLNRVFIKYITRQLPFVTVKIAQSLDGKIAASSGDSRWISSEASRRLTHKLRRQVDAILVGINTVLIDNPLLTCRLNGRSYKKQPKKIVVDSKLRLGPGLKIFSVHSPAQVIIATTRFASQVKIRQFSNKQAQVIVVKDRDKKVDLRDLLCRLAKQQITHILIEGGGELIASALKMKLVDRMVTIVAPKIIGGRRAATSVEGEGIEKVKQAITLEEMKARKLGTDLVIEGRPEKLTPPRKMCQNSIL